MRDAFSFFRAYYNTALELNNNDRLSFYDAIIHYQFTGDKSKLKALKELSKFAFISQEFTLDKQVNGYIDNCKKTNKIPFNDTPAEGVFITPAEGGIKTPSSQEEEEGEVEGQVQVQVNISPFSFEEFWKLYPHKKERKDCEQKWKKLTNEQKQKIKNTLPYFLKYKPFDTYTHPNPKTYLNKQRWDDEIPITQNQPVNQVQTPYQLEAEMWTKYTKEQIDTVHKHFYAQMELPSWFDRKYEEVANPDRRR